MRSQPRTDTGDLLLSLGLGLLVIAIAVGSLKFWGVDSELPQVPALVIALLSFALISGGAFLKRLQLQTLSLSPASISLLLLIVLCSDWLTRRYNFIQGPDIRGEIVLLALASGVFLSLGFQVVFRIVAPLAAIYLAWCFFDQSDGFLLFSDDHATFFYRLSLLRDNFPFIPFYTPVWNAGMDARDFFATGALNVFLLASPLIYLFPLESVYNVIVALLIFGLIPLCSYFATRVYGLAGSTASISALLSLVTGITLYRWGLNFGTLGFITSTALLPLVVALAIRVVFHPERMNFVWAIIFIATLTLTLFWSLAGFALIPLILFGALRLKHLLRYPPVMFLTVSILVINLPWIGVFWSVSNVSSFISAEPTSVSPTTESGASVPHEEERVKKGGLGGVSASKSLKVVRDHAVSMNPLLLLLTLPGIFLLGLIGIPYGLTLLWLIFIGSILSPIKPQLELERMLLIATLLATVPTAAVINQLFERASESIVSLVGAALTGGVLVVGMLSSAAVLKNRTIQPYFFAGPNLQKLIDTIKGFPDDGRILFTGFALHELERGHLAPLTLMTGKQMVASSPMHDTWRYRQVFPKSFLDREDQGVQDYLDLMNATYVVAHEREWLRRLGGRPEQFELLTTIGRFAIFKRLNYQSNYFFKGSGTVLRQNTNSVVLRLNTPEATIKFRYFPFVEAVGCTVAPESVAPELALIKLSDCITGSEIRIRSRGIYRRLFP